MKNIFHFKLRSSGFALIYTLLFVVLLLITVSATWLTGMADLRLSQRSNYSVQAYQLAQAGVDDGFVSYKDQVGTAYPVPAITDPTSACGTPSKVFRVNPNVIPATSPSVNLSPPPALADTVEGRYDYRICTTGSVTTIEGVGYYKGSKITLKATVTHVDTPIMGVDAGGNPVRIGTDHNKDYLTTYQTGPSQ